MPSSGDNRMVSKEGDPRTGPSTGGDSGRTLGQHRQSALILEQRHLYSETMADAQMWSTTWNRYYEPLRQHLESMNSVQTEEMYNRWNAHTSQQRFWELQSIVGTGSAIENHIAYGILVGRIRPEVGNPALVDVQEQISFNAMRELTKVWFEKLGQEGG